jgi:hypothetical protein
MGLIDFFFRLLLFFGLFYFLFKVFGLLEVVVVCKLSLVDHFNQRINDVCKLTVNTLS